MKVKCIWKENFQHITIGKIYDVIREEHDSADDYYTIINDKNIVGTYFMSKFEEADYRVELL